MKQRLKDVPFDVLTEQGTTAALKILKSSQFQRCMPSLPIGAAFVYGASVGSATHVGVYVSADRLREVTTEPILTELLRDGSNKTCWVPKMIGEGQTPIPALP